MSSQLIRDVIVRVGLWTGLDIAYLLKNGNWVTLRFLTATVTGFVLSLVFARFSEKELLGQYQLTLSLMSILSVFSFLGLNAAALEAVAQGREAAVFRASKSIFRFSLAGSLLMVVTGIYLYFFGIDPSLPGAALIITGLLFPVFYATSSWSSYYEGKLLFKESSLRMIVLNIVVTSFLVGAIFAWPNLILLVSIYLLTNVILQGVYLLGIRKNISKTTDNTLDAKFGIAVSFQKFVSGLSTNIPPIALSFYFGVELLAVYYIAYYAVGALSSFLNSLMALYLPILFKRTSLDHKGILLNSLLSGIVTSIVFIGFLKIFFLLIYGQSYVESLQLAYLLSPLLILAPFHTYLVSFFSTRRKNRFLISVFCLSNVLGLIVLYLVHNLEFVAGTAIYLTVLECATVFPLIITYYRTQIQHSVPERQQ